MTARAYRFLEAAGVNGSPKPSKMLRFRQCGGGPLVVEDSGEVREGEINVGSAVVGHKAPSDLGPFELKFPEGLLLCPALNKYTCLLVADFLP